MNTETYVVHVTKECNCNCVYCYEKDKESEYSWEEIKILIDEIVEKSTGAYSIEFLGGEPLLRLDLIKKVVDYIPDAEGFGITTNGTIVTEELIEFLKTHHKVHFAASMDGHKLSNMLRVFKNGHNTHDVVVENFKRLIDAGLGPQISIHMVTHNYNVPFLYESVEHLYNIGVRYIGIGTVESTMIIDERYCKTFLEQMEKLAIAMKHGKFPQLGIHQFKDLKPKDDQRTYIRDNLSGKIVAESYGRSGDDITKKPGERINVEFVSSPLGDMIYNLREKAFKFYNSYMPDFGLGTGRCGSKSLAKYIQDMSGQETVHEPFDFKWGFNEEDYAKLTGITCNVVFAGLINYVPRLIQDSGARFICVERPLNDFISSFMRAHSVEPKSSYMENMPNVHQYPEFHGTLEEGLKNYWEYYRDMALMYQSLHPRRFEYISFRKHIERINNENSR